MCIGSSDNGQCYGMASEDDCTSVREASALGGLLTTLVFGNLHPLGQWPNPIAATNLPAAVQVWYHTDPEAA